MQYQRTHTTNSSSKKTRRLLFRVVCIVACGMFGYKMISSYVRSQPLAQHVSFTFDKIYSRLVRDELIQTVRTTLTSAAEKKDLPLILDEISSSQNYIQQIRLNRRTPEEVEVTFVGSRPVCIINDRFLLDESGGLHEQDRYDEYDQELPHIQVAKPFLKGNANQLLTIARSLSVNLISSFNISYRDFYDVLLKPKNTLCHYSLVADEKTMGEGSKINAALALMNEDTFHSKKKTVRRRNIIADVRFKDRIYTRVACKDRGEGL